MTSPSLGAAFERAASAHLPGAAGPGAAPSTKAEEPPSGLPPEEPEETPLGVPAEADEEDDDGIGPEAMPGIPTEGDPPAAG